MYDGSDTIILYDELAYSDVLPVAWRPFAAPPEADLVASYVDGNIRVLQACAALEEHSAGEKPEENSPHSADLVRIDFKVNLLLDLVGKLLAVNHPRPKPAAVRFNARGATFRVPAGAAPKPGAEGVLEIHLHDALAEPVRLQGRVARSEPDGEVAVKFLPPGEAVADLIEKLAFRRHRRRVAGSRQPRRGP
jgi:hypothetical protein